MNWGNARGSEGTLLLAFLNQHGRQGRYDKDVHYSARPEAQDLPQGEGRQVVARFARRRVETVE